MRFSCTLLAAAAALALSGTSSIAADYDPPIFVEEAPEYVPVEIGSGWYLRGDVSYDVSSRAYDFALGGAKASNNRVGGGIGFGYHFSDQLRADLTVSYLGEDRFRGTAGSAEQTMWSGLISGYYDIATIVGITPYIGAGLGFTYTKQNVNITGMTPAAFSDSSYEFAYALMAGASYKVTDNVSVDAGYQFLHTPDQKYYDVGRDAIRTGDQRHLLKVGLRYDLW